MEMAIVSVLVGGVTALSGLAIYVVRSEVQKDVSRLDGRINTHERGCEERQKNLNERHAEMTKKLDAIDEKVDRLVARI